MAHRHRVLPCQLLVAEACAGLDSVFKLEGQDSPFLNLVSRRSAAQKAAPARARPRVIDQAIH
jgi:hypothetical protein